jgi:hypothetical protein
MLARGHEDRYRPAARRSSNAFDCIRSSIDFSLVFLVADFALVILIPAKPFTFNQIEDRDRGGKANGGQ